MKKTVAIICEYNPFHQGHLHLIRKVRERYGDDSRIISVMSGHFVQRGEPAIFDKFVRAKAAVLCGVNLVLEFPFPFCVSGAGYFARFGVDLISRLGVVDVLAFGSANGDVRKIEKVSDAILTPAYETALGAALSDKNGSVGFAEHRAAVLAEQFGADQTTVSSPNDILAVEYLAALKKSKTDILPYAVPRSDGLAETAGDYLSASAIRQLWQTDEKEKTKKCLCDGLYKLYSASAAVYPREFGEIVRKSWIVSPPTSVAFESNREILDRIRKHLLSCESYDDLVRRVTTARYTRARINRALLHTFFGTLPLKADEKAAYTQLLAADRIGLSLAHEIRRASTVELLTKPSDYSSLGRTAKEQAAVCAQADELYAVLVQGRRGDCFLRSSPFILR